MQIEPLVVSACGRTELGTCTMRVQRFGDCFIVRLHGEIDVSNASNVRRHLCGLVGLGQVVVDLSDVTLLEPSALTAFLSAAESASRYGRRIHLAQASGVVRQVIGSIPADAHVEKLDDITDALELALSTRDSKAVPAGGAGITAEHGFARACAG